MSEESPQHSEGCEDEVDVLAQGAKELKVRMYSTAVVAQQFFSKLYAGKDQADDDPAATLRRLDCHKQLLTLRAMNVKVEHGEEEGDASRKEEELQEWLDGIEARKAAHNASKKKSKESKGTVKRSATVPDRLDNQRNSIGSRSRNQGNAGTRSKAASNSTTRDSFGRGTYRPQPTDKQVDSLLRGQFEKKL